VGQQRFRVHHIVQQTPYIIAAVEMLSDESNIRDMGVTSELQATYKHYWQAVAAATGSQNQIEQLPDDTVAMTYHLAHQMQVTNERKQRWLESDVVSRAKDIVSMLHAEMALLPGSADNDVPGETNWPWSWN
jgi:Lon protease-like protein